MPYLIVDGMNLVHRSRWAFKDLTDSSGLPSGHFYGFLVTLQSQKKKHPDCKVIVAWDCRPLRRLQIYSTYKANRSATDFGDGIRDIKAVLSALNVIQAQKEGEEADDVIAALSRRYVEEGETVYIYARDKDLLQLVQDGKVVVLWPNNGSVPDTAFDEEAVRSKFGVDPGDLKCYLVFRGDEQDNIPGVSHVRSKTISHLATTYHTPRSVYTSLGAEQLTDFERESLQSFESQSYINEQLVSLRDDFDPDIIKGESNQEAIEALLHKYGVKKIKAQHLIDIFAKEGSFHMRTAPAVKEFSLFGS